LAAELGRAPPGRLIMAAISAVFTIGYVANLLGEDEDWVFDLSINMFPEDGCLWVDGVGEDEDWVFDLSINMFPEDGCLWVDGVGEDGVPAFTRDGIENLRQIIPDERAAGRGPPTTPTK